MSTETTTQRTIEDFIAKHHISMSVRPTDHNPYMEDSARMYHWRVTLRRGMNGSMTVTYSQGSGHNGDEPTLADVLDCLASDAGSTLEETFDGWCAELGYDTDSRKAKRTYDAIERQSKALERMLGRFAFIDLIDNVARS